MIEEKDALLELERRKNQESEEAALRQQVEDLKEERAALKEN